MNKEYKALIGRSSTGKAFSVGENFIAKVEIRAPYVRICVVTTDKGDGGTRFVAGAVASIPITEFVHGAIYKITSGYQNNPYSCTTYYLSIHTSNYKILSMKPEDATQRCIINNQAVNDEDAAEVVQASGTILKNFSSYKYVVYGEREAFVHIDLASYQPNIAFRTNNTKVSYDKGICRVGNQPHEIDKMWTRLNGVLREV